METRMQSNTYETGRLNLPFVGHCTFAKSPVCVDWDKIDADVAILGAPNDMGTQWRSGARFGPRSIREASTLFAFGHSGAGPIWKARCIRAVRAEWERTIWSWWIRSYGSVD